MSSAALPMILIHAIMFAGCDSKAPDESTPRADALITTPDVTEYPIDAEEVLVGRLGVDADGCVTLVVGGEAALLWAPYGSTLVDDGSVIEIPHLGTFRLGQDVVLDGKLGEVTKPIPSATPRAWVHCVGGGQDSAVFATVADASP